jgi:hypothetical protein
LTDIRNRGVRDVFFLVCDGLKGPPEAVANVWPLTTVQTCITHLIRNTFRLASRKDWDALKRDVKTGLHRGQRQRGADGDGPARRDLGAALPGRHPAVGERLGRVHPVPGLRHRDPHRAVLDERDRVAERPLPAGSQGQRPFPDRTGSAKCLYLVTRSLDPTGDGKTRWAMRWKPALNAFAITFADGFPAAQTY